MVENIELVVISFLASFGFGIVFQIRKKDLFFAGLGGAVTRIFYIIFMLVIPYRIVYCALAAFVAALYSEILSRINRTPATIYLYPSIIPLIPGDLLYYTIGGIVLSRAEMFKSYAADCILALIGLCIGFVICSTVTHYIKTDELFKDKKEAK